MSIFDKVKEAAGNQFIEVIEWLDATHDTMLYRFPVAGQEIKNGAQLIVRESQAAVFVFEGQVADVFAPGRYTIDGGNTPILSKLGAWKYGFNSPFKSEVYFVNTKQFTDLKWGTSNPVMMRDADFGMVRLRAFGIYSMRVADPRELIKQIAGTNARFVTEDIEGQLRRTMVSGFAVGDAMAGAMTDAMKQRGATITESSAGGGTATAAGAKCVKCGSAMTAGSKFCNECGASQAPAKCSNCQHELKPGAKFCDEC